MLLAYFPHSSLRRYAIFFFLDRFVHASFYNFEQGIDDTCTFGIRIISGGRTLLAAGDLLEIVLLYWIEHFLSHCMVLMAIVLHISAKNHYFQSCSRQRE
jgi:hypothetical protein